MEYTYHPPQSWSSSLPRWNIFSFHNPVRLKIYISLSHVVQVPCLVCKILLYFLSLLIDPGHTFSVSSIYRSYRLVLKFSHKIFPVSYTHLCIRDSCLNLRQLSFPIEKHTTYRHTHRHFSKNDFFSCFKCSTIRICNNLEHDFFCHHHTSISLGNMEVKRKLYVYVIVYVRVCVVLNKE